MVQIDDAATAVSINQGFSLYFTTTIVYADLLEIAGNIAEEWETTFGGRLALFAPSFVCSAVNLVPLNDSFLPFRYVFSDHGTDCFAYMFIRTCIFKNVVITFFVGK